MVDKKVPDAAEHVPPPRARDLSFYVVLFVAVIPLWLVVPSSWVFVVYVLRTGKIWTLAWRGRALFAAALCEVRSSDRVEVVYAGAHLSCRRSSACITTTSLHSSAALTCSPNKLSELQKAFTRVLQSGLADLPEDGFDEETLDSERPGSPAEQVITLQRDDPRAVDFRNYLRTW